MPKPTWNRCWRVKVEGITECYLMSEKRELARWLAYKALDEAKIYIDPDCVKITRYEPVDGMPGNTYEAMLDRFKEARVSIKCERGQHGLDDWEPR